MNIARNRLLVACLALLCLTSAVGASAVTLDPPPGGGVIGFLPSAISTVNDYFGVASFYNKLPGFFSNYNKCLARGSSADVCHSVMVYCAINEAPLGGIAGSYINLFGLMESFKVDCGNGVCFACCFVPGSLAGCHSAFHSESGEPVLNCNPNLYGGGTREVGLTLVTDPDPEPGQGCLFTPQTCDHIGICNSTRSPEQIAGINADPNHIMKSTPAADSKARAFGTGVLADWNRYLSGYHTSADHPSDFIRQSVHPFSSVAGLVTGRGCPGWKSSLPASFPTDWSEDQFRIESATGVYSEEASHYNGIRQLGVARILASVPNLFNRWASVESQIWTPAAITQYLAQTPNPDAVLLEHMSPLALDVLKQSRIVQDYRLLAVPLPGESISPESYNGCELADPPALTLAFQTSGSLGISLQILARDSAASSALPVELKVLWGDGGVTRLTAPPGGALQTITHNYAAGGRYQVLAIAENDAGLRTVGAVVVATSGTGTNPANTPVPVISEVQLVDLQAQVDSFSGNTLNLMFELESWTTSSQGYALGISKTLPMPLNTTVKFGTVAGWNPGAEPMTSVTIRPSRFGDGFLIGFQGNYFTLDHLRLGIYSTQDNFLRYQNVPVTPSMLRLYPAGSSVPVLLTAPTYTPAGRLKIPVELGGVLYSRVDVILPQSVFSQGVQGPVADPAWAGFNEVLPELKPGDRNLTPPQQPLDFYALPPCRLVDTRGPAGSLGAPALQPGASRDLVLTGTACGVPATAKAVSLNVTVIAGTAPGNLRVYPGQGPLATASTLNFSPGATLANNTIMALDNTGTGAVKVYLGSTAPAHLLLDVNGYFQ